MIFIEFAVIAVRLFFCKYFDPIAACDRSPKVVISVLYARMFHRLRVSFNIAKGCHLCIVRKNVSQIESFF